MSSLFAHMKALDWDGKLIFAGEHTSFTHGWIQGAFESGLRAAYEVHTGFCL